MAREVTVTAPLDPDSEKDLFHLLPSFLPRPDSIVKVLHGRIEDSSSPSPEYSVSPSNPTPLPATPTFSQLQHLKCVLEMVNLIQVASSPDGHNIKPGLCLFKPSFF